MRCAAAYSVAPAADGDHQLRIFQHLQMLHHRAAVDFGKVRDERARGERLVAKIVEDLPAHLMSQRLEDAIVLVRN